MFDPTTGRWFEEDPQNFGAGDPDLFRYVKNAPTSASDPSGQAEVAPEPRLGVPKADWGVAPAQGYAKNSWMVGENDGSGWWLMIPQVSIANLNDGKAGYGFNIVARVPDINGKQSVFLNRISELGIFDSNKPTIGPIITTDKAGTQPTGDTGDTIYSIDVGGDLGPDGKPAKYKLDIVQRSGIREKPKLTNPTDNTFPILRTFATGDAPAGKLFLEPHTDISGRGCTHTVTVKGSGNADWIIWVQRVTKIFGFVNEIKVSQTGQHFLSKEGYDQYMGEIKTNFNAKPKSAPAVTMQYTYIFIDQTKTANITPAMQAEFRKLLETELALPTSDIDAIAMLLDKKLKTGKPVEQLRLDNPRNPKDPLQLRAP